MRLRIAKKVLNTGTNAKFRKNYIRKKAIKLRPPRYENVNGETRLVYPSWHDIPIIKAAWKRMNKRFKKYKNNNDEM